MLQVCFLLSLFLFLISASFPFGKERRFGFGSNGEQKYPFFPKRFSCSMFLAFPNKKKNGEVEVDELPPQMPQQISVTPPEKTNRRTVSLLLLGGVFFLRCFFFQGNCARNSLNRAELRCELDVDEGSRIHGLNF
jgi:hypothetical protein